MVNDQVCVPAAGQTCGLAGLSPATQKNQVYKTHRTFGLNLSLQQHLMSHKVLDSAALLKSVLIRSPQARALRPVLWEQFSLKFSNKKKKRMHKSHLHLKGSIN